jgi:GNAT superfamily N-acetyltransferase
MNLRTASARDAKPIADLHAESWRRHYRGAFRDSFLDGDIFAERLAVWSERLANLDRRPFTVIAEELGEMIGFAHTIPDHDTVYGALLDNLHVRHDRKRCGVGSALMRETARVLTRRNIRSGLHLWVLEQNKDAQAFYSRQGGVCVGRGIRGPFPGGGTAPAVRYYWPDPAVLLGPSKHE